MKKKLFAALVVSVFLIQTLSVALAYAAAPSDIEKVVFVHYANNAKARPPPSNSGTYKLMGIKWLAANPQVQFAVNSVDSGLSDAAVKHLILLAANEWDDGKYSGWAGTSADLFYNYKDASVPSTTITAATYDQKNEIVWTDLGTSGTIAMTSVWYNRATKAIVEFDMEFNTYYLWSATGESGKMDLQNIATHELGHSVGLADLYKPTATQETMYGYSDYGVITARDLYFGDQAGIKALYG